jgi:hypothetical protein
METSNTNQPAAPMSRLTDIEPADLATVPPGTIVLATDAKVWSLTRRILVDDVDGWAIAATTSGADIVVYGYDLPPATAARCFLAADGRARTFESEDNLLDFLYPETASGPEVGMIAIVGDNDPGQSDGLTVGLLVDALEDRWVTTGCSVTESADFPNFIQAIDQKRSMNVEDLQIFTLNPQFLA